MNPTDATTLITELLNRMGVPFDTVVFEEMAPHSLYVITSPESKLLIGPQGATLDALNHLLRRQVEQRFGEEVARTVSIDVNGYRKQKIEEIQNKARMVAERVRLFRSSVELSPMSAYERMIIHALFADDPDIMTESEGEGKFRRIVIKTRTQTLA
jgi:spoIIIJ-associated protein